MSDISYNKEELKTIIKENNFYKLKNFINNIPNFVFNDDDAFDLACLFGDLEIVEYLTQLGANIQCDDNAPLKSACLRGSLPIVQFLIENGADIHVNQDLPLVYACEKGYLDVVKFLNEHGADIYSDDYPLYIASARGQLDVCVYLYSLYKDEKTAKKIISEDFLFANTNERISEDYLNSYIQSSLLHKKLNYELHQENNKITKVKL